MCEFFDLSVPFLEDPQTVPTKKKKKTKDSRRKLVAKVIELGYSGIAYNKHIHGSLSSSDGCAIPFLPLSSLIETNPALLSAVKFHREILGVPLDAPLRQYTRLTVAVDSVVHESAINSGNPILKTYDLIAIQPMNQVTFDQACKLSDSEVQLISIDFSKKLPFRLKLPMIKAAIKRGLYFEINYAPLVFDAEASRNLLSNAKVQLISIDFFKNLPFRLKLPMIKATIKRGLYFKINYAPLVFDAEASRDLLLNAKLLVQWTRGKNLIVSSAAPTTNELRAPLDVANLLTLLNLSRKRAEAAISTNCRSLVANALRKKQYYKGAIKIERIGTDDFLDIENASLQGMCNIWDPISSGGGDLVLKEEEIAPSSGIKRKLDSLLTSNFSLSCIQAQGFSSSQPWLVSDQLNETHH